MVILIFFDFLMARGTPGKRPYFWIFFGTCFFGSIFQNHSLEHLLWDTFLEQLFVPPFFGIHFWDAFLVTIFEDTFLGNPFCGQIFGARF